MLEPKRTKSNVRPQKFEDLKNGYWFYNYDIRQCESDPSVREIQEVEYEYIQVRIEGKPDYQKCVKAVIRQYVDQEEEFNLINSYNSYQMDIALTNVEYEGYLTLLKKVKEEVGSDFLITPVPVTYSAPKQSDVTRLMVMTINTLPLTDNQALSVKSLYPNWSAFIGQTIESGIKVQYEGKLFKVIQQHLVQSVFPPSINTASLYTEIIEEHSGTVEDPIPYPSDGNMIIYADKYYTEDDILYRCIRDSVNPLYAKLSSLVGHYVEIV